MTHTRVFILGAAVLLASLVVQGNDAKWSFASGDDTPEDKDTGTFVGAGSERHGGESSGSDNKDFRHTRDRRPTVTVASSWDDLEKSGAYDLLADAFKQVAKLVVPEVQRILAAQDPHFQRSLAESLKNFYLVAEKNFGAQVLADH